MEEYVWVVPKKTDFSRVWILIITFKLLNAKWSYFEVSVVYVKLLLIKFCPPPPPSWKQSENGELWRSGENFPGKNQRAENLYRMPRVSMRTSEGKYWLSVMDSVQATYCLREREKRWSSCTFPWEKLQRYNYQHTYVAIISAHSQSSISTETDSAQVTKCFWWELFLLCWAALEVGVIAPLLFFSHFIAGLSHKSTFSWCDIIGVCK